MDDWEKTTDYGVFYPHLVGDDREDFRGGGIAISAVEARDLYPVLDAQGGLYIDASQYRQGIPPSTALPTASIRVNTNYLDRFPILDETGEPIVVSPDEQAWVVIVPAGTGLRRLRSGHFWRLPELVMGPWKARSRVRSEF